MRSKPRLQYRCFFVNKHIGYAKYYDRNRKYPELLLCAFLFAFIVKFLVLIILLHFVQAGVYSYLIKISLLII